MAKSILRDWAIALALGFVAVVALAGCAGDDPPPEPETAESQTVPPATATTTDAQTEPSARNTPQAADADESPEWALTLDRNTSWQDVFVTLTASEQACIRDLGDDVTALLARNVLNDEMTAWESHFYACLDPETGRDLLLGSVLLGMEEEGWEADEAGVACLSEVVADIDPATVVAEDEGPEVNAFVGGVWRCLPDLFFESFAAEIGVDLGGVSEPEFACIHEWFRELDVVALLNAITEGDDAAVTELVFRLFRCSPALLTASFGDAGAELDAEAETCVRQLLDDAEASDLVDEGSPEYERFYAGLLVCVPALPELTDQTSAPSGGPDDHADFPDGATVIAIGVQASGELGSDDDTDYFVFEAEQDGIYRIDIALVTLSDSVLTLYDAEWRELASSDDYSDTLASRVFWQAEYSGEHYIEVWGYGLGAYTVLVEAR